MNAVAEVEGLRFDLSPRSAHSIAIPMDFEGPQPSFFGAPPARRKPLSSGSFTGDTREGGSCNCEVLEIIPHCNGTHTECVGHITRERATVPEQIGAVLAPALLVSLSPEPFGRNEEQGPDKATAEDPVITREALRTAFDRCQPEIPPQALVLRTLPNSPERADRDWMSGPPSAWFTLEAVDWLAGAGIRHLLTDQPSIDRPDDDGQLLAHHRFWGLPQGSDRLGEASRAEASVTEMILVPDDLKDGLYLLDLQLPPLRTDAVPSNPLLYPLIGPRQPG